MGISALVLLGVFTLLLLLNAPIAIGIAAATLAAMLFTMGFDVAVTTVAQRMVSGINSFTMVAIPLFILSGILMGRGGIAHRLIELAKALIGTLPGGLALVNVLSTTLFGAISGSAVASASAMGGFMVPAMEKEGYDRNFSAALTAASSTAGLLIPPSNVLIIYSLASGNVSIAALFIAGYVPGILLALSLMAIGAFYAIRHGYPVSAPTPARETLRRLLDALPSLLLIVIVIGGIVSGIFTATEASGIAVLYALFLSTVVYREVRPAELPGILLKTAETSAIVLFLVAASSAMSWMLSYENIPQQMSSFFIGLSDNPLVILMIITLILLLVGAFIDITPAILIFTPIFLPVVTAMGMSPLHFGIVIVLNLCIGICTPPVGSVLFVGCSIARSNMAALVRPLLPMYVAMFVILLLITYVPALSEWLPRTFGLI
ncbi:TRAP transporter large permease [Mangrovimicrobium sediminis]|uniref:TRAP transporter large permease protein n=1 Tax=Mangrovimicrobium sediminis TaxID=2562682 RepID=A0A4Z0LWY3_9GAMM|nr:TRAP transporter large permease [Haliea sp. SAOS-164]TGD71734.1 TRAP transporter large permease [Haliea sp. SAOS-164]